MAWKYKDRIIAEGTSWTDDDGVKHPDEWIVWSDEDKKKMGLTYEPDPEPFDSRFYYGRNSEGKLVELPLDDSFAIDLEGKDIVDAEGNKQPVTGLKNVYIHKTKMTAKSLLNPTDWYVVRKAETDKAIPNDIATYRAKVKTDCQTIEDKINACKTLADFIALFDPPSSGGNAPIFDFSD